MTFLNLTVRYRNPLFALVLGLLLIDCSLESTASARDLQSGAAKPQATLSERTALDDYIARPDTNYSYQLVTNYPGQGQTTYILEMTSQPWLTTNKVDRPIWKN